MAAPGGHTVNSAEIYGKYRLSVGVQIVRIKRVEQIGRCCDDDEVFRFLVCWRSDRHIAHIKRLRKNLPLHLPSHEPFEFAGTNQAGRELRLVEIGTGPFIVVELSGHIALITQQIRVGEDGEPVRLPRTAFKKRADHPPFPTGEKKVEVTGICPYRSDGLARFCDRRF